MNKILEKALETASRLPDAQQEALAALILEEIEDEALWDNAFAQSPALLERLAAQADEEERQGLTQELHPDKL